MILDRRTLHLRLVQYNELGLQLYVLEEVSEINGNSCTNVLKTRLLIFYLHFFKLLLLIFIIELLHINTLALRQFVQGFNSIFSLSMNFKDSIQL